MAKPPPTVRARLRGGVATAAIVSLLAPGPGLAAAPVVDTTSPSTVTNVTREQLEELPAGRRLEDLIRTCPGGTIPTVSSRPQLLVDGSPTSAPASLDCLRPTDVEMIEVYKQHNSARAIYGAPPLAWDPGLALSAGAYVGQLARIGKLVHASREGRGTVRENISQGLPGWSAGQLVGSWVKEKQYFRPGIFPNVSTTGDWYQVGHWTQMIWAQTVMIGCAKAAGIGGMWLVCRYDPGGNKDGKPVGIRLPIIAQGAPPVININNPAPQPANAPQPVQANAPQPQPGCQVAEPDDWIKLINQAAAEAGYAKGSDDPRDAATDRQWDLALQREQEVQDKLMTELATLQGNVATNINAYLAASSAWQERYSYIASSTTGLQGLLTDWMESREIYEKADLAFALLNLGVGGAKLGFKAYRFLAARRAAAAAEAAQATTTVAATGARTGEAAVSAAGETQIFNRTLVPPGQNPNVLGMRGYTATSSTSGRLAGSTTAAAEAGAGLDPNLVKLAREAGVNIEAATVGAYDALQAEGALMEAIAAARGWHGLPKWVGYSFTNLIIQARKVLGGVEGARISPQDLEILKSLKTYIESKGINFAEYLRTAAGATTDAVFANSRFPTAGEKLAALETDGIIRFFDNADIDMLLKIADTGGDAAALRNAVSPVAQASLNGLARADAAAAAAPGALQRAGQFVGEGACGTADAALSANRVGGPIQGAATLAGKPTDAQLANVLDGTGELGRVGLRNVVDQFGVTDRFTEGQSLPRAMVGELWDFITSPSTTTASFYYTNEAQKQYLDLLQNQQGQLIDLGTKLDDASRALRDLETTLQRAGLDGPGSYLGTRGPTDLRRALDDLQRTYDSGSDDWKRRHQDQMDQRRDHITQKLGDLAETVADLNALAARMHQVRGWLDSVRLTPDGKLRGPVEAFNPMTFVRLGSIGLYLKGMGADMFGLTSDVPFRVVVPQPQQQPPQTAGSVPAESWDAMMERLKAQSAALDAAPEVEVDPDLDAWLNGVNSGG
jgi:hypothetical protein